MSIDASFVLQLSTTKVECKYDLNCWHQPVQSATFGVPPKLWLVAVGKAIGAADSILIVVAEAEPSPKLNCTNIIFYFTFYIVLVLILIDT